MAIETAFSCNPRVLNFGHNNSSGAGAFRSVDGCSRVLGVVETVRNVSLGPEPQKTGRGCTMKKVTLAAVAALAFSATSAFAADLPVKAVQVAAAQPPAW